MSGVDDRGIELVRDTLTQALGSNSDMPADVELPAVPVDGRCAKPDCDGELQLVATHDSVHRLVRADESGVVFIADGDCSPETTSIEWIECRTCLAGYAMPKNVDYI